MTGEKISNHTMVWTHSTFHLHSFHQEFPVQVASMTLFDPDKCQLTPHSELHQSGNPNSSHHEQVLAPHHTEIYKPIKEHVIDL